MRINEVVEQVVREKAGLVPYFRSGDETRVLLMKPSDPKWGGKDWQIAKGLVEDGESVAKAAYREAYEELGLRSADLASPPSYDMKVYNSGEIETSRRPYQFYLFSAPLKEMSVSGRPHFETGATKWLGQKELSSVRKDQVALLREIFRKISERIDEDIVDFPIKKHSITRQGKVRKSDVIGKLPSGQLIYQDQLTGLPYVRNKQGTIYMIDPDTHKLPGNYREDEVREPLWMIVNDETNEALGVKTSESEAENEARRLRNWFNIPTAIIKT